MFLSRLRSFVFTVLAFSCVLRWDDVDSAIESACLLISDTLDLI